MQVQQFFKLLHHPQKITAEDVAALHALVEQHPYFQAAYMLLAKAVYDADQPSSGYAVQKAAVYATDRHRLKAFLEKISPFSEPTLEVTSTNPIPKQEQELSQREVAPPYFLNSYIHSIQQKYHQKITKKESLAQLDSMKIFLQKNVQFKPKPLKDIPHDAIQADLTHKSTMFHHDLATESLARVLQQQGKWQRALDIYEKLKLKFPKKKAYFTTLIEQLKRQS